MNKTEFLAQLERKLSVLPENERADALYYYEGYISDAQSEAGAIAELGSPAKVAAIILADYVTKDPARSTTKKTAKTAWLLILALFAVPVGLPILIGVAAAAFGLFIGLASVVFAFFVSGGATLLAGMVSLLATPFVLAQDAGLALVTAGYGVLSLGLGILFIQLALYCMGGFKWIARFVGRKIRQLRGENTEEESPYAQSTSEDPEADEFQSLTNRQQLNPEEEDDDDDEDTYDPAPPRRKIPWNRVAIAAILIGGVMTFSVGVYTGAHGGDVFFADGRIHVLPAGDLTETQIPLNVNTASLRKVSIQAHAANVEIRAGDELRLYVRGGIEPAVSSANSVLTIDSRDSERRRIRGLNLSFGYTPSRRITLYVPRELLREDNLRLTVDVTSGNVRADNFHGAALSVQTRSGNIRIENFRGETLSAQASSGNIRVNDSFFRHGTLQTSSGNVNVDGGEIYHITARATSGNVTVQAYAQRGARAALHTTSGNTRFTRLGGTPAAVHYDLQARSGTIRVNSRREHGRSVVNTNALTPDLTVEMRTTSGNVNLEY